MIRILIVDDHPALRAGLVTVLRSEPGLVPVGAVPDEHELWPAIHRTRPDVVLLDYHLPPSDGLVLCRQLKRTLPAPGVLLFSAYAESKLVVPARLAGADGLMSKSAPATEVYDAIRTVARGDHVMPPVQRELLHEAATRLDPDDLPILAMAIDGTSLGDIGATLRLDGAVLSARLDAMIRRLRVEVPVGSGA
jgi:DNA-binding NarL/FixJ family response regulator